MNRYRYYFTNTAKPISIEATNKASSRHKLEEICNRPEYTSEGYSIKNLAKETVETLVAGVSEKTMKDVVFIWDGNKWEMPVKTEGLE